MRYDITGAVTGTAGPGGTASMTSSAVTNYAAPVAITANNYTNTLTYTNFLAVSSVTGQNTETAGVPYGAGRPTQTTSPHGAVTNLSYSTNPPMITETTNQHWVRATLDGLGRPIKVERGDGGTTRSITDTEYAPCACSPLGKMKRVSQPYAPGGTVYWKTYTYDGLGRTLTVTASDGAVTSYLYQANTTKATDPAGKWKKYVTDAMGNLTQVIEPSPEGGTVPIAVYGTGIASGGGLAADGTADSHYTLISSADSGYPGPGAPVVISNAFPIPPWVADGPSSKWIAPRSDAGNNNQPGSYTYRTTFDLTGYNAATASLTGQFAADDSAVIKLNGVTVGPAASSFSSFTSFTITSGFAAGVNTLDFVVTNGGANPTGLRVDLSGRLHRARAEGRTGTPITPTTC
jgi:YD repeat-containing protein